LNSYTVTAAARTQDSDLSQARAVSHACAPALTASRGAPYVSTRHAERGGVPPPLPPATVPTACTRRHDCHAPVVPRRVQAPVTHRVWSAGQPVGQRHACPRATTTPLPAAVPVCACVSAHTTPSLLPRPSRSHAAVPPQILQSGARSQPQVAEGGVAEGRHRKRSEASQTYQYASLHS